MTSIPTRWVVALESEAAPIRNRYGLSQAIHDGPFVLYRHPEHPHWLVVSGMGTALSAGATAFLAQRSEAPPWSIWLNVGIAGHGGAQIGSVHLAHTIVDRASMRTAHAALAMKCPIPSSALHTVHVPESGYPDSVLYDMEGSGFYAIARRLATAELVHCIKVVSDNPTEPVERFTRERIAQWIESGLDAVERVHDALVPLARIEEERLRPPECHAALSARHALSVTQRHQLTDLLRRAHALGIPSADWTEMADAAPDGRAFLGALRSAVEAAAPRWCDR